MQNKKNAPLEESYKIETPSNSQVNSKEIDPSCFMTGFEVLNTEVPDHKFFIQDLVPLHVISLICGPSDTGKSILARQIAVAAAIGKSEVAGFPINLTYNKAIYVSTEDGINDWKEKLLKYNLSSSELQRIKNLSISFEFNSSTLKMLEAKLKVEPVDVIVIDVFSDAFSMEINNTTHVRQFLEPFKRLTRTYKCNIFFIHHISKKGQTSTPSKINVVGSQGIESAMRCVLELRSDPSSEDHRQLIITKSNYVPQKDKNQSYRLLLKPTLEFEYQGDRAPITDLGNSKKASQQVVADRVLNIKQSNPDIGLRGIEKRLSEEGISLGKTRIGEIIKQSKQNQDNPDLLPD